MTRSITRWSIRKGMAQGAISGLALAAVMVGLLSFLSPRLPAGIEADAFASYLDSSTAPAGSADETGRQAVFALAR